MAPKAGVTGSNPVGRTNLIKSISYVRLGFLGATSSTIGQLFAFAAAYQCVLPVRDSLMVKRSFV
jgi:hypothetical protein